MSSSERFPPRPGSTLDGRFVILEELGSGGTGVVLAVQHLGLRRQVAIKVLHPELARSGDAVARFLREARAAARLRSEHVVHVMEVATLSSGVPYFVMEYLAGADLGAILDDGGPLPFEDVVDYALQALEALAEAHRLGLVHRDLEPANLFLTTSDDDTAFIKVLDFGISKLIGWEVTSDGTITRQGSILGSPLYCSPEQVRDARSVDARSDIWSLGAVMHELLTGRPPFEATSVRGVIDAILHAPYEPPVELDLPHELVGILMRCLRKSRDDRYPSAEALARAFQPLARSYSTQRSIERILRSRTSARPRSPSASGVDLNELGRSALTAEGDSCEPVERDTLPSLPVPQRRLRWVPAAAVALVGLVAAALWFEVTRRPREQSALAQPTATDAEPTAPVQPSAAAAASSSEVPGSSPQVAASAHPKPGPESRPPPSPDTAALVDAGARGSERDPAQ